MNHAHSSRRISFAVAVGMLLSLLHGGGMASAQVADWQAPQATRLIGGPSEPGVFAWGLDYDPVHDELLVSDYLNRMIRRFDRAGNLVGSYGDSDVLGFYSGVAVDPSNGDVYTHTFGGNSRFIRFGADRGYAGTFDLPGGISAFLAFGADGYLYGNVHKGGPVLRIDPTPGRESIVQRIGSKGTGPGQVSQVTGVDVGVDGRVYAVDPGQGVVHVWNADGSSFTEMGAKGRGPGKFPGDARGVVLDDANDRVYVADSDESQIEVFTLDGDYVDTFGSVGNGLGQFSDGARELAVTPDGHLWAADYGNQRLQEFAPDGTPLGAFPTPAQPADPWGFSRPRDVEYNPTNGELLVADPWNQRFQRFTTDGELIAARGRRGSVAPDGVNYPRSIGVDPDTGNTWLANYEGVPGITVLGPAGNHLFSVDVPQFANDVQFHDGEAYVPFRGGNGIVRIFDSTDGRLTRTMNLNSALNGVAIDPANGNVYVAFDGGRAVRVYDRTGAQVDSLAVPGAPWGVDIVGDVVYVSDTSRSLMLAFDRTTGDELGRFGSPGNNAGQLRNPSGIDHDDAGNLYVSEAGNNRVTVFSPTTLPADDQDPTVAVESPAAGSAVAAPLVLEGTAADSGAGVAKVEVLVQDRDTGLWWNADRSSWGSWTRNAAAVSGDLSAPDWHIAIVGAQPGGDYFVQVRVTDLAGNESPTRPSLTVEVSDLSGPSTTIARPVAGPVPDGPIAIAGSARDDQGVRSVEVQVVDPATGDSWDPSTSAWVADQVWTAAALTAPDATDTDWSLTSEAVPAAGSGDLVIAVRGTDVAGNSSAGGQVTVTRADEDVIAPQTTLTAPASGAVVVDGVEFGGTATDDQSLADVQWAVKDRATNRWLDASDGSWGPYIFNPGNLDLSGPSADFGIPVALPEGSYWGAVRAVDTAGNVDDSPAGNRFTVEAGGGVVDEAAPTATWVTPANDAVVAPEPTVTGTATDDVGVASVEVAVKNRSTNQWWDVETASWGGFAWNGASLADPGATSTSWELASRLPVGDYWSMVRALDTSGNPSERPSRRFQVEPADELVPLDRWNNRSGTSLGDIPSGTMPDETIPVAIPGGLVVDTDADSFGARVRVLVRPDVTGDYTFWLASDDQGVLRLDPSGTDPAAATAIATVPGWTNVSEWNRYAQQRSAPIRLEAGREYYLEGVFKEGSGGDHLAVAWQRNGNDSPVVVPSSNVSSAGDLGLDGWEE